MNVKKKPAAIDRRRPSAYLYGMKKLAIIALIILALSLGQGTSLAKAQFFQNLFGSDDKEPYGSGREGKCGTVDLVIAIDTTNSMAAAIRDMKREAIRLLDLISFVSAGDYRLGLISFRDRVTVEIDLGSIADPEESRRAITWAIRHLQADGGKGGPEASDEALRTAILGLPAAGREQDGNFNGVWKARSRMLVLITDNLPGGFDDKFEEGKDDVRAREIADNALSRDIHISSVYIPTAGFQLAPDPRVSEIMRAYPQITGGVFAVTQESGRGAAEAITDIVDGCGQRQIS